MEDRYFASCLEKLRVEVVLKSANKFGGVSCKYFGHCWELF